MRISIFRQRPVRILACLAGLLLLSGAVPATARTLLWGNTARTWLPLLPPETSPDITAGQRAPALAFPDVTLAIFSHAGKLPEALLQENERAGLQRYLEDGGMLVLTAALPAMLFQGEGIHDLSPGQPILGASRYDYNSSASTATPLAQTLADDDATLPASLYPAPASNHPGLGGLRTMQVLFGNGKTARVGVNRVGRGLLLYVATLPAAGTPYADYLRQLLARLSDPQQRDRLLPAPSSNQAIRLDGKTLHLAIADTTDSPRATDFLREKLRDITGAQNFFPLPGIDQLVIQVGQNNLPADATAELAGLHPFGYLIRLHQDRTLILTGRTPQGTIYAVNDFLKRFAGYRCYAQGELFEITPRRTALELPAALQLREEPDIHSYHLAYTPNNDFGRNARLTCQATHALDHLVPVAQYAQSHPEYYPLINGQRKTMSPEGKNGPWNPCTANPDLPALTQDYAKSYFAKNPDRLGLPMGVNDGGGDCQCPECARRFSEHGNQYAEFYNVAARALAASHPDKLLAFIAYSRCAGQPPRHVSLESNILVEITGMGRSAFKAMPLWHAAGARHFGLYDYIYTFGGGYVVPRYYPRFMAAQWRAAYRDYQLKTIWAEYYPRSAVFAAPRQHVLDELAWDMDADVDALLDDYFTGMYGPAAAPVRRFFDRLEEIYVRNPDADVPIQHWKRPGQMEFYRWDDLDRLQQCLRQADAQAATAADEKIGRRLALLNAAFTLSRLHVTSFLCGRQLQQTGAVAAETEIAPLLDAITKGYQAIDSLRLFTLPEKLEKELFTSRSSLDDFKKQSSLNPLPLLEREADRALQAASACLERLGHDRAAYWKQVIATRALDGDARKIVATQIFSERRQEPNLIRNPSFEENAVGEPAPTLADDHRPFRGVPGWSTWTFPSSTTRFFRDDTLAADGAACAGIDENQIAGSLIGNVKIAGGCRYRWSFMVRRNRGDEGFGMGSASVRMQHQGKWLDRGSAVTITYPESCENNWVRVETTFTAPDYPEINALLLLGAPRQAKGARTCFDQVSLVKIYDPNWSE